MAIDGYGDCTGASGTCTMTLSTSNANDIIICFTVVSHLTAPSVCSGASLTWTSRANEPAAANIEGGESYAESSSALTSASITCKASSGTPGVGCFVFGISGADYSSPFDSANSGNPYAATGTTNAPAVTISTNNANDMIVSLVGQVGSHTLSIPSSFTTTGTNTASPTSGGAYKVVSLTQSSLAVTWGSNAATNWVIIDDAIQAASGGSYSATFTPTVTIAGAVKQGVGAAESDTVSFSPALLTGSSALFSAGVSFVSTVNQGLGATMNSMVNFTSQLTCLVGGSACGSSPSSVETILVGGGLGDLWILVLVVPIAAGLFIFIRKRDTGAVAGE